MDTVICFTALHLCFHCATLPCSLSLQHNKMLQEASYSSSTSSTSASPSLLAAVRTADSSARRLQSLSSPLPGYATTAATLVAVAAMAYGFYCIGPTANPWGWDGYILLSRTHRPF